MYEALCKRFGFYFVGNNYDNGGSLDLKTLCGKIMKLHEGRPDIVDREFTEDQFKMLIIWRWLIYSGIKEHFEKQGFLNDGLNGNQRFDNISSTLCSLNSGHAEVFDKRNPSASRFHMKFPIRFLTNHISIKKQPIIFPTKRHELRIIYI